VEKRNDADTNCVTWAIYFGIPPIFLVLLSSCVVQAVLKNTEKNVMVVRGKYPTGNSLINSQKPIFPRRIAGMSHSKVHETENVLDEAIEAVEVKTAKNRYIVT
jgi:hypothetical protein